MEFQKRGIGNCINCLSPYKPGFKTFMTNATDFFGACEFCGNIIYLMNDLEQELAQTTDPAKLTKIQAQMKILMDSFNDRSKQEPTKSKSV